MSHGNQQRQIYSRWAQRNDPVQLDIGPEEMAFAKRDPVLWRSMVKIFSAVNSMQRQLRDMDPGIIDNRLQIGPDGKVRPRPEENRLFHVSSLILTSNSPAAGRIAWSGCTVTWNGVAYPIAGGNTPSSSEKFVTWTLGATTFSAVASFTPAPNTFLIATNDSGTADEVWNKIGNKAIQEANLAFGLNNAYSVQDFNGAVTVSLTSVADTTLINETAEGVLLSIGALYGAAPTGNPTAGFKITVDGSAEQYLKFWDASNAWANKLITSGVYVLHGGGVFSLSFNLGIVYRSSVLVKWSVTSAAATGGPVDVSAWRALKVA